MTSPALLRIEDKISIVSDEISDDFKEIPSVANSLKIKNFELRNFKEGRIPYINKKTIEVLVCYQEKFGYNYTLISPGFFKHSLKDKEKTKNQLDDFSKVLDLADLFEIDLVSVFSFKREEHHSDVASNIFELLLCLKSKCEERSIDLIIENSPTCWANTSKNLLKVSEKTKLGVNWDPGNSLASDCTDHQKDLNKLLTIVKNIHLKNWKPAIGYCSIMTGAYDLESEICFFIKNHYMGYFCIEHHQWNDRINSTIINYKELKSILKKAHS
jgi:sugar phosphate isomerase/epimerase